MAGTDKSYSLARGCTVTMDNFAKGRQQLLARTGLTKPRQFTRAVASLPSLLAHTDFPSTPAVLLGNQPHERLSLRTTVQSALQMHTDGHRTQTPTVLFLLHNPPGSNISRKEHSSSLADKVVVDFHPPHLLLAAVQGKDRDARTQPAEHSVQILNLGMNRKRSLVLRDSSSKASQGGNH
ncbi:hypothetical protein GH733_007013 [Mirounga leonina]|nr:hypothetical protein GH733_007013 [Mirounga leonina]